MGRFHFDGLTLSQRVALTWLIWTGGTASYYDVITGGTKEGAKVGAKVTRATMDSLIRRGYLDDKPGRWRVQIGSRAISEACKQMSNPHPEPIMTAVCESLAHNYGE